MLPSNRFRGRATGGEAFRLRVVLSTALLSWAMCHSTLLSSWAKCRSFALVAWISLPALDLDRKFFQGAIFLLCGKDPMVCACMEGAGRLPDGLPGPSS
jgi:hypothetical protein